MKCDYINAFKSEMKLKFIVLAAIVLAAAWLAPVHGRTGLEAAKYIENLSNNSILSIFQDRNGYLWLGSYDGLNRYDGKRVAVFRMDLGNPNGLSGNIISDIYPCTADDMWVLTTMGLDRFSTSALRVTESHKEIKGGRQLMAADTLGHVFVKNLDGSLSYYDPKAHTFHTAPGSVPRRRDVTSLSIGSNNTLWCFTSSTDIFKVHFDFSKGYAPGEAQMHWTSVSVHNRPTVRTFPDAKGFYLLDDADCLYHYNPEQQHKTFIADLTDVLGPNGSLVDIAPLNGDLILAFTGMGLGRLVGAEGNRFETVSNEVGMFRVLRDMRQPIVWCATDGRGLYKFYDIHTRYSTISSSQIPFLTKPIRTFYTDANRNLWVGTKGNGLIIINDYPSHADGHAIPAEAVRHVGTVQGLPDNQVFAIRESRYHPGRIWLATRGPGISYANASATQVATLAHPDIVSVHDIFEESDSVLWLASTTHGLLRASIDPTGAGRVKRVDSFLFKKGAHLCDEIYSVAFDGRHTLYIGCRGGLGIVRFNIRTHKYDFVEHVTDQLPSIGDVICLNYSPQTSTLYFGTSAGAGILDCRNPEHPTLSRVLTRADGMVNDMTHAIIPDRNGNVWISTNKGLVRYSGQNDAVHNITGLTGDIREFCDNAGYISPHNGDIVFGALNGIAWMSSERTAQQPAAAAVPRFYFNGLTINGSERNINEMLSRGTLSLPSDAASVGISFTALDYINGDDINYYYRLDGYTDEWTNLGTDPSVTFTNLPPGNYTLRVKLQSDVVPTESSEFTLPIHLAAPWYATVWAYVAYVVLFLAAVGGVFLKSRAVYRRKRREMERSLVEQQQAQLFADRTEFFTNITHELCSPLTMIQGLCNIMRRNLKGVGTPNSTEMERYVDSMQAHSSHLNELVQEILDFRKMEEGGFRNLRVQTVDIGQLFERRVESYREIASDNDITFRTSVEPRPLEWSTDLSCLNKIVTNLTSNAFKYTPVGGVIEVTAKVVAGVGENSDGSDGSRLVISVYNTGTGIAEKDRADLFDRYTVFNNVDRNGYRDMASRHGLGLYICSELVGRLGGEISVDSAEGQWTRFEVSLPRLAASAQSEATAPRPVQETPVAVAPSQKPEILVVDDNPDILWLVADVLSDNYTVARASSVADAMEQVRRKVPALIITDIMMPDTNGLEFIKRLRADKFTKNLPILILTAKVSEQDKIEGYNLGADAYVAKPFTPDVLRVIVGRLLSRREADKDYYRSSESAVTLNEGIEVSNEDKQLFDRIKEIIAANIEDESKLRPAALAAEVGMDVRTLYRKFKKCSPVTPNEYVKNYRYAYAAQLLRTTNLTIQEVIYRIGLTNKTVFYADFRKIYGMTPKEYRDAK